MATDALEPLLIQVQLEDSQFQQQLQQLLTSTKRASDQLKGSLGGLGDPFQRAGQGAAAAKKPVDDLTRETKELAAEALNLRSAYQGNLISQQQFTTGLQRVQTRTRELSTGLSTSSANFGRLARASRTATASLDLAAGRLPRLGLAANVAAATTQSFGAALNAAGLSAGRLTGALSPLITSLQATSAAGSQATASVGGIGAGLRGIGVAGGVALGAIGLAAAGITALTIRSLDEVGQLQQAFAVLRVSGVSDLEAVEEQLRSLTEQGGKAALQFSRAELAGSLAETVKAGVDAGQAFDLLAQGVQLAAAEATDLDATTGLLLANLRQFKLGTEDAGRAADSLAKAGLLAASTAADLSQGLSTVGSVAQAAGFTFEETLGLLVALDNQGLEAAARGSRGLRSVLTTLLRPSERARDTFARLGINLEDSSGNARDLKDVLDELRAAIQGSERAANDAAQIFDSFGITAILGLGEDVETLTGQIEDSEGALRDYADEMTDTLPASAEAARNALNNLGTTFGEFVAPAIAAAADKLSAFILDLDRLADRGDILGILARINPFSVENIPGFDSTADILGLVGRSPNTRPDAGLFQFDPGEVYGPLREGAEQTVESVESVTVSVEELIAFARQLKSDLDNAVNDEAFIDANRAIQAFTSQGELYREVWAAVNRSTQSARSTVKDFNEELAKLDDQIRVANAVGDALGTLESDAAAAKTEAGLLARQLNLAFQLDPGNAQAIAAILADLEESQARLQEITVSQIFANINAAGTAAVQQAARSGDSVEATVESLTTRFGVVRTGLDQLFAAGLDQSDARVQFLENRAAELGAELRALGEIPFVQNAAEAEAFGGIVIPDITVDLPALVSIVPQVEATVAALVSLVATSESAAEAFGGIVPPDVTVDVSPLRDITPAVDVAVASLVTLTQTSQAAADAFGGIAAPDITVDVAPLLDITPAVDVAVAALERLDASSQAAADAFGGIALPDIVVEVSELRNIEPDIQVAVAALVDLTASSQAAADAFGGIPRPDIAVDVTPLQDIVPAVEVAVASLVSLVQTSESAAEAFGGILAPAITVTIDDMALLNEALFPLTQQLEAVDNEIAVLGSTSEREARRLAILRDIAVFIAQEGFDPLTFSTIDLTGAIRALGTEAGLAQQALDGLFQGGQDPGAAAALPGLQAALRFIDGATGDASAGFEGMRADIRLAGNELVITAERMDELLDKIDQIEQLQRLTSVIQGIGDAITGLGDVLSADTFSGFIGGLTSVASGIASIIPGGALFAPVIDAAGQAIQALGDLFTTLFDDGSAAIRARVDEIAAGSELLSRDTVEALLVTATEKRDGLLGLLGFTREAVNEEATQLGVSIAEGIAEGLSSAFSAESLEDFRESFRSSMQSIVLEAVTNAFILSASVQEQIAALTKLVQEALEDGVITAGEAAAIDSAQEALLRQAEAFRAQLEQAGLLPESDDAVADLSTFEIPDTLPGVVGTPAFVRELNEGIARFGSAVERFVEAIELLLGGQTQSTTVAAPQSLLSGLLRGN